MINSSPAHSHFVSSASLNKEALIALREFLDKCWAWSHEVYYNTGFHRKEEKPEIPSTYMCRHTSVFLLELLSNIDKESNWKVIGGWMATNDQRNDQHHWWLESDNEILDLTADQFGWDPITITDRNDLRYKRNLLLSSPKASQLKNTLQQWKGVSTRDWMESDSRFQYIKSHHASAVENFNSHWHTQSTHTPLKKKKLKP